MEIAPHTKLAWAIPVPKQRSNNIARPSTRTVRARYSWLCRERVHYPHPRGTRHDQGVYKSKAYTSPELNSKQSAVQNYKVAIRSLAQMKEPKDKTS